MNLLFYMYFLQLVPPSLGVNFAPLRLNELGCLLFQPIALHSEPPPPRQLSVQTLSVSHQKDTGNLYSEISNENEIIVNLKSSRSSILWEEKTKNK